MNNCRATEEELQECNGDCWTCEYDTHYEGDDYDDYEELIPIEDYEEDDEEE